MKKLLIAILFVLVSVSGFAAGTTKIDTGNAARAGWTFIRAYQNADQTLPSAGSVATIWGTEETDALGELTNGTFTPKVTGYYEFSVTLLFESATAGESLVLSPFVNGAADLRLIRSVSVGTEGASGIQVAFPAFQRLLAAGGEVSINARHDGTGAINLISSRSALTIRRIY